MQYTEVLPDDLFSHHIESYWQMPVCTTEQAAPLKLLLPTCTFNIIFIDRPCLISTGLDSKWLPLRPGAVFFGQRSRYIHLKSRHALHLCGVRFKPFAFATIIKMPIAQLNDGFFPLEDLFSIDRSTATLIQQIIKTENTPLKVQWLDDLMAVLFRNTWSVDETLRAQLNYIMWRRGCVKVRELLEKFKVSKVTLRKHFLNKVGFTPKKVAQIWRMNYLLQMKEEFPDESLTGLCLDAGFYDQAHFIKDFKAQFGVAPRQFFTQNSPLVKMAHQSISKRFTHQYDPR